MRRFDGFFAAGAAGVVVVSLAGGVAAGTVDGAAVGGGVAGAGGAAGGDAAGGVTGAAGTGSMDPGAAGAATAGCVMEAHSSPMATRPANSLDMINPQQPRRSNCFSRAPTSSVEPAR